MALLFVVLLFFFSSGERFGRIDTWGVIRKGVEGVSVFGCFFGLEFWRSWGMVGEYIKNIDTSCIQQGLHRGVNVGLPP